MDDSHSGSSSLRCWIVLAAILGCSLAILQSAVFVEVVPSPSADEMMTLEVRLRDAAGLPHLGSASEASGTTATDDEQWSCADHPRRCAVLLHAFAIRHDANEATKGSEFFWLAYIAALTLRTHYPELPLLLATNYRRDSVLKWLNRAAERRSKSDKWNGMVHSRVNVFDEVISNESWDFVLKADAMLAANTSRYDRVMYLDSDVMIERRAVNLSLFAHSFFEKQHMCIHRAALSGKNRSHWVAIHCGSGTAGGRPRQPVFDVSSPLTLHSAFDILAAFDMALVGEIGSFGDAGPYLYNSLPKFSHCFTSFPETHNCTSLSCPKLQKFVAKNCKNQVLYEQQYNTGMVAFRNNPRVRDFMQQWGETHRRLPRCLSDKVLWDQCSFPIVLRQREDVRVATLPETFNFREAIGSACGPLLAKRYGGLTAPSPEGVIVNHEDVKLKAPIILVHELGIDDDLMVCRMKNNDVMPCKERARLANLTRTT